MAAVEEFYLAAWVRVKLTLGAETFTGRKFRDFRVFWHFSRKFLPRHNPNSKFAKVFAREITGNSRLAKVFTIHYCHFFKSLR